LSVDAVRRSAAVTDPRQDVSTKTTKKEPL
jgi:hypothetical protein